MASNTAKTWARRDRRHTQMGKRRKKIERSHSTPSYEELFKDFGEPGKPAAPSPQQKA